MLTRVVLIIDKRKELSVKYKKLLEGCGIKVFCKINIAESLDILTKYEPDMILISDSIQDDVVDVCKKIRVLSYNFRPVLIVLSKSSDLGDMINTLNSGADDFLSEPLETEEFLARINAHFRRHFENNINNVTKLFDSKISFQYLRRLLLNNATTFFVMLIDIKNLDFYRELYGDIATEKMLQTYQAIITSTIDKNDYLGHLGKEDFILVTQRLDVEKIASYCVFAFDKIIEKFYSNQEHKNSFMMLKNIDKAEKNIALVTTSIGIISNEFKHYKNVKELITNLINTHKLAKLSQESKYVIDRQKLSTTEEIDKDNNKINIFILEPDEALAFLIETVGTLYGYECKICNTCDNVINEINIFTPVILIINVEQNTPELNLCKELKKNDLNKIKIIATSNSHNKIEILNSGADVYLPKPYEITELFAWVKQMLESFNNTL